MDKRDSEEYLRYVRFSKLKKALRHKFPLAYKKSKQRINPTSSILLFRSFLYDNTEHTSFTHSLNHADFNVTTNLLSYVAIHSKKYGIAQSQIILNMVLLDASELIKKELTALDIKILREITSKRCLEIFQMIWKHNTTP